MDKIKHDIFVDLIQELSTEQTRELLEYLIILSEEKGEDTNE